MRVPLRREAKLLARALRARSRRLDHPLKLTWAVTYACQSGCLSCSIWKRTPSDELRLPEIRRLFERATGFAWVDLTGGEPFLRNDLEDIAATVVERSRDLVLLHLPTNGLDPDRVERGVRAMLGMEPPRLILTVSVDGPPGLNEVLRGDPAAWTAAMETFARLRRLRSAAFDVYLGVTLQSANVDRAAEILPAAKREIADLEAHELHWNVAQGSEHFYGNAEFVHGEAGTDVDLAGRLRVLAGDDAPPGRHALDPVRHLDRRYRAHVATFLRTGKTPLPCRALWSTAFLDPRGVLYPCITWDHPLGSVRDHDLDLVALWKRSDTAATALRIGDGDCPQCWTPCEAVPTLLGRPGALLPRGA